VSALDRLWGDASVVTSVGPIDTPSHDALVGALEMLATACGLTRVGLTLDDQGTRWSATQSIAEYCSIAVRPAENPTGDPGADAAVMLARGREGLPIRVFHTPGSVSLSLAHSMGDGVYMSRMLAAVVSTARTAQLPDWATKSVAAHPLRSAMWQFFGHKPSRFTQAVQRARARAAEATGSQLPLASTSTGLTRLACTYRGSTRAAFSEMKAWRRANAAGVSTVPLTFAAAHQALIRAGVDVSPKPLVLFDGRRYLSRSYGEVPGNFAVGLYLEPGSPGDGVQLDVAMRRAVEEGRPLTAMSVGVATAYARSARSHLPQRGSTAPQDVGAGGRGPAEVAFSHMGRPADILRLPWTDDGESRYYAGVLTPSGPRGITLAFSEIASRLHVSASFYEPAQDAAIIGRALDMLCADPAGMLEHSDGRIR
jgi:hypothetical protein